MMREIKFRAWTGNEMITPPNETIGSGSSADIIELSIAGHVSRRNAYGLDGYERNPTFDEPEKDIVLMQFTGLKDRKGIDIYDGDVLIFGKSSTRYAVSWNNDGWVAFSNEGDEFGAYRNSIYHRTRYDKENKQIEIIGNIYENPELIKN